MAVVTNYDLMMVAVEQNDKKAIGIWLARGVNLKRGSNKDEHSFLTKAIFHRHFDIVPLLINSGADVNDGNLRNRLSPLDYALVSNCDVTIDGVLVSPPKMRKLQPYGSPWTELYEEPKDDKDDGYVEVAELIITLVVNGASPTSLEKGFAKALLVAGEKNLRKYENNEFIARETYTQFKVGVPAIIPRNLAVIAFQYLFGDVTMNFYDGLS